MKFNKEVMESDGRNKEEKIIKKYKNPTEREEVSMPEVYPTNSRRTRTLNSRSKSKSRSRSKSRNKRSATPVSLSMF